MSLGTTQNTRTSTDYVIEMARHHVCSGQVCSRTAASRPTRYCSAKQLWQYTPTYVDIMKHPALQVELERKKDPGWKILKRTMRLAIIIAVLVIEIFKYITIAPIFG